MVAKARFFVFTGQRFGRLTVTSPETRIPQRTRPDLRAALCTCDCGGEKLVRLDHLLKGAVSSCGCLRNGLAARTGQRFGRWTVLDPAARQQPCPSASQGMRAPLCRCDCGTEKLVQLNALLKGISQSCGCLSREILSEVTRARNLTHGLTHHPLFATWTGMLARCENPEATGYRNYGGRGIEVCGRWHDVRLFIADIERLLGPRPDGMTLDRWPDNNGNYEPGNVRWATQSEQLRNRRRWGRAAGKARVLG